MRFQSPVTVTLAVLLLFAMQLLLPVSVAAAEDAGHESPLTTFARWLNFAVLFGGLVYVLKGPISAFFQSRTAAIRDGLEAAARAEQESLARMAEVESKLSNLSIEIADFRKSVEQETVAETARIVDGARREVEQIVAQSSAEIARIARIAERDVRQRVAAVLIQSAEQQIQNSMNPTKRRQAVDDFIESLGK